MQLTCLLPFSSNQNVSLYKVCLKTQERVRPIWWVYFTDLPMRISLIVLVLAVIPFLLLLFFLSKKLQSNLLPAGRINHLTEGQMRKVEQDIGHRRQILQTNCHKLRTHLPKEKKQLGHLRYFYKPSPVITPKISNNQLLFFVCATQTPQVVFVPIPWSVYSKANSEQCMIIKDGQRTWSSLVRKL